MLNQAFWRNGAWFLKFQQKSKFRSKVCYLKQYCAVNKETSVDNYESLTVSAEKEVDVDVASKSELAYFATETLTSREQPQSKHKGRPSLRQTLSYTNRALFGPLLETAAEKRRRIKAEEDEDKCTKRTRKHKKGKKKKPAIASQPLIKEPENAHFLGLFPGPEPKYIDKAQVHKVKIQPQDPEMGGFSDPRTTVPRSKVLIFKKSGKNYLDFDRSLLKDISSVHKLSVASWDKEKESNLSSCWNEDTPDEGSQADGDALSGTVIENNANEYNSSGNTSMACGSSGVNGGIVACSTTDLDDEEGLDLESNRESSSHLKSENDQEMQELESSRETSSLLYIDNTKFSSAPSVIDYAIMENFPLDKTDLSGMQSEPPMIADDIDDDILTIGMFDGGYQRLPSVSKILEATMPEADRRVLERWKAKMIRKLGEEGFEEYRKGLLDKGKLLHGCIQSELTGVSPGVENLPTVQGIWTSISHVLPNISNVSVLESRLVHPYLYYQGAVDCVATYKEMPVLIDWKTSTKPKLTLKSMFDNPLQVVAYLGALNFDSNYQFRQVRSAMIVVAYDSGLPAHVHIMDKVKCQAYWRLWCARLVQFWRQLQIKEST